MPIRKFKSPLYFIFQRKQNRFKIFCFLFFFFFFLSCYSFAQQNPNTKLTILKITFKDTLLTTGDKFIIQSTDTLRIEDIKLKANEDYKLDYRNGAIIFPRNLFSKYSLDTSRIYDLKVNYDLFPYSFKDVYSNFDISIEKDTLTGDTIQVAVQRKDIVENLFEGTNLEKSGSIFRGFTIGSNRDLTLNSGFRLQLNGKLSKDIDIVAALTDENTPIQPEGNTQKLQELDKVFIEVKSKNLSATIGDIDINFQKSEFLNFNRKIQGAKGYAEFNFANFLVTGAVSRGKFSTNSFNGSDGVQGPYRLVGANNEINILVLSGTEKVFLNGIQMVRGEQADYTIDYGLGQITFTNKRLITNASRIVVDFEYSDKKYSRTFLAFNNKYELFKKKLSIGLSYVNESDNENKPIDFTLSDSDKVILKNAGDDRLKASKSGVSYAGRDSISFRGIGAYVKVDTVINANPFSYYKFAPGDTNAVYNVNFSFVGQGNGDYTSQSSYQYSFAGIKQGSYAPIIYLPVPTSYQVSDITLEYSPFRDNSLFVKLESAYSLLNKNKFSDFTQNKGGVALFGNIGFTKNDFKFFGIKLKGFNVNYKQRVINKLFNTLDRINDVEFNRNFDAQDTTNATEDFREGNISILPGELIKINGNFGQLKKGDFFNSFRTIAFIEFNNPGSPLDTSALPKFKYSFERIKSDYTNLNITGNWMKHVASLGYRKFFGKRKIGNMFLDFMFDFNSESRKNSSKAAVGDSLKADSFSFFELIPRISLNDFYNLNIFAEFNYRKDDNADRGFFVNTSNLYTQRYGFVYNGTSWLSSNFDLSIQNRLYSDYGRELGNVDNKTVLINSRVRLSPLSGAVQTDLLYSITSERTARIQKMFVLVPVGQGNYIYLGDLNTNGIQDENEFQLVNFDGNYIKLNLPTDQFFPTVDLKTSARIVIKPSRYFFIKAEGFIPDFLNNISTETYYRIDEKSKDPVTENLYFLRFKTFLNEMNTLVGSQLFQQDINLFENNPMYNFRFRYIQQRGFSQYSSGNERLFNAQRSMRLKLGLTKDVSLQFEFTNKTDRNNAPVNSTRNRNINSNSFNSDLTYRPIQEIESGFQINYSRANDYYPTKPTNANINQEILRFIYSFATVGRLRLEVERDEILLNTDIINFPYELTNGKVGGKSYFWRMLLDYNISKNVQASVNYDGRVEGKKQVIHTGRAQVTAFF